MEEAWERAYICGLLPSASSTPVTIIATLLFSVRGARHRLARVLPHVALQKTGELQLLTAALSHFSHY